MRALGVWALNGGWNRLRVVGLAGVVFAAMLRRAPIYDVHKYFRFFYPSVDKSRNLSPFFWMSYVDRPFLTAAAALKIAEEGVNSDKRGTSN